MEKNNKCIFILPFFGKFNNYFPLFLKSCEKNSSYNWLIITDCKDKYLYPSNVNLVFMTLDELKERAEKKFGFSVCLESAYKLCDYKPAYGFLFEEYIKKYEYWGHCDCDLLFGDLEILLDPLLEKGYDKLFAAGHLTIYKNNFDNNRRFMKPYKGRLLFKEAYKTDEIFVMDEDCAGHDNVHSIFCEDGARVFEGDLSMNATSSSARFLRSYYDSKVRGFVWEKYKKARYYWTEGNIKRLYCKDTTVLEEDYLYIHLQNRKMRWKCKDSSSNIEILPDRFRSVNRLPNNKAEMKYSRIGFCYLYWVDVYLKKLKNRLKRK